MWKVAVNLLLLPILVTPQTNVTIVDDIWKAFRAVTNDSELLQQLIPEMYGSSLKPNANPKLIFRMPTAERGSYQVWTMSRSDLAEPIFPNISARPAQTKPQLNTLVKSGGAADEWQQLGLDGWRGELQPAQAWQEQTHKDAHSEQQIKNVLEVMEVTEVTDISLVHSKPQEASDEELMNAQSVYIARANDPFGYSMMWPLSRDKDRGKRDVAKLYSMIKCSTGCDPLIYKGYGCYCGFGGRGVPTDGIDRCCRQHDKCYEQSNCISYLEYFVPYVWKCYRGKPLCALDHGEWGAPDSCAARLCQCDLRLSRCLRKFYCPARRAICYSSRARRLQNLLFFD